MAQDPLQILYKVKRNTEARIQQLVLKLVGILIGFKTLINQLKKEALKESVLQSRNQDVLVVQKH